MQEEERAIKNDRLVGSIRKAKQEASEESTVRMLNEVVRARLIAPVSLDKPPARIGERDQVVLEKDTVVSFELIKAANGDVYYPVFTDGSELKKCVDDKNQHSLIVNFEDLANMILKQESTVKGFAINPMGENICFSVDMIKGMLTDMKKK